MITLALNLCYHDDKYMIEDGKCDGKTDPKRVDLNLINRHNAIFNGTSFFDSRHA